MGIQKKVLEKNKLQVMVAKMDMEIKVDKLSEELKRLEENIEKQDEELASIEEKLAKL